MAQHIKTKFNRAIDGNLLQSEKNTWPILTYCLLKCMFSLLRWNSDHSEAIGSRRCLTLNSKYKSHRIFMFPHDLSVNIAMIRCFPCWTNSKSKAVAFWLFELYFFHN
jgi:hypothetical protein